MFVDRWNQSLDLWENLSTISNNTEKNTEHEIDSVKEQLNWLELERFRWTPSHLEELLSKWYILGLVINQSLNTYKKWDDYNFQKYSFLKMYAPNSRKEIRVYFDVETNENNEIERIYILAWKVKQLVSKEKQANIYNHFTNNVNKYRK